MNVVGALPNALSGQATGDPIALSVMKRALDQEAQNGVALINAIPQPPKQQNLPSHLGQNVNTTA
jgi:hypothetical protein